jgi:antitoxin (DNA-binding transcriptional repressor) of toxin-antitoxin stability system
VTPALILSLVPLLVHPAAAAKRGRTPPPSAPVVAAPTPSADEQALVDAIGARNPAPADYLFMLDTAGGGLQAANDARADIAEIVQAARDGDTVTIVSMHTRAVVALEPTRIDGMSRVSVTEQIRNLSLTSGHDSDLGAGLSYIAQHVGRGGSAKVHLVYFMSAFCHQPSTSSEWDGGGGAGCRQIKGIDRLVAATSKAATDRLVAPILLRRPLEAKDFNEGIGLEAVRKVLGGGEVVSLGETPWAAWAAQYKAHAALNRLRPLIDRDLQQPELKVVVVREPTAQNPVAQLEIGMGMKWIDVQLENLVVDGAKVPVQAQLRLTPSAVIDVPVNVPATPFAILPHDDVLDIPLSVRADATIEPSAGLSAIGRNPALGSLSATVQAHSTRSYGLPWWMVAFLGLGLGVTGTAATVFLRRRLRRVRLGGSFSYRREGGPRTPIELADREEVYIAINAEGHLVPGRRNEAVLALRMVKQGMDALPEAEILVDGVEINKRPAKRGRHRVVAGATSFQFGEYRLAWE